jgi:hypothetical protein
MTTRTGEWLSFCLRIRKLTTAAAITALGAGTALASGHADATAAAGQYGGTFSDDPAATVSFSVDPAVGKKPLVTFEAANVLLACDDGTSERATFNPFTARLRRDGTFSSATFGNSGTYQGFYEFAGRIMSGNRARGYIIHIADSIITPAPAESPDCSTYGKRKWAAQRVQP